MDQPLAAAVAGALRSLLFTDQAADAVALLQEELAREDHPRPVRAHFVPVLCDVVQWRPELLSLATVLELAGRPSLRGHREFLLGHVLERYVFVAPQLFDPATVDAIAHTFADRPRLRYVLSFLAARPGTPAPARARIDRLLAGRFPLRALAQPILRRPGFELLVVHNVKFGQGDDTVRLAPLLQALLDANPTLRVTLVAKRLYLFDHPRVATVPVLEEEAVQAALARPFDGVVYVREPDVPEVNWRPELSAAVEARVRERGPDLVIRAEVGGNHFAHESVVLAGREIAAEYALDRLLLDNIYETGLRLLAEFGLPARAGEEPPRSESLLVGTRSPEAEAAWERLTAGALTGGVGRRRRVALVNPFGGSLPSKGFVARQAPLLAEEITGLVREGLFVVLLPNGTRWVDRDLVGRVLAPLDPDVRERVAVAPDPAELDPGARLVLGERAELAYADRLMRLFKYFAAQADLIVTVEGWLSHLAYGLGRPFRLMLMPHSQGYAWLPHGRGPNQRLVTTVSPASAVNYAAAELLRPGDPPPLPHQPRKHMLRTVLHGLGRFSGGEAIPLLLHALASEDWDVRSAATAALGQIRPLEAVRGHLLTALRDREATVRAAAAEVLLGQGVDCARELGPRYRELLRAHRAVVRRDWDEVVRLGAVALPALFAAAQDENRLVRREARWTVASVLSPHIPVPHPGSLSGSAGPIR